MSETSTVLMEQFSRTFRLLHRYKFHNRRGCTPFADSSQGQGRVLALLNIQPEITQKELGYLLGIRNQSISELVAKLEKVGYVTKSPSESDKRVMIIRLTEKGKEVASKMSAPSQEYEDILDCLTPEEQKNFTDYLGRINGELEKAIGEEDTCFDGQENPFEHFRAMLEKYISADEKGGFDGFRSTP